MSMTKMHIKYACRCTGCGKQLSVGEIAYGGKDPMTLKWMFACAVCGVPLDFGKPTPESRVDLPEGDGSFDDLLAAIEGKAFDSDIDNMFNPEKHYDKKPSHPPQPPQPAIKGEVIVKPTALELIKKNAIYGGV